MSCQLAVYAPSLMLLKYQQFNIVGLPSFSQLTTLALNSSGLFTGPASMPL